MGLVTRIQNVLSLVRLVNLYLRQDRKEIYLWLLRLLFQLGRNVVEGLENQGDHLRNGTRWKSRYYGDHSMLHDYMTHSQ